MKQSAPDWPRIVAEIVATGMTPIAISRHPGIGLSLRAITYLGNRDRGQQPLYHRGWNLLVLWGERTGKSPNDAPQAEVVRGFRRAREAVDHSPRLQNLPAFPAPVQRTEMQGKKRRKAGEGG